jgi:alkylation response protein AidB-like acyl-CoA dehydrogenase
MSVDPEAIAMLSDSAHRYAGARYSFAHRRAIMLEAAGCSLGAWRDYAELGWLAVCLPETHGGLDANPAAVGALMEVVGSHLLMGAGSGQRGDRYPPRGEGRKRCAARAPAPLAR